MASHKLFDFCFLFYPIQNTLHITYISRMRPMTYTHIYSLQMDVNNSSSSSSSSSGSNLRQVIFAFGVNYAVMWIMFVMCLLCVDLKLNCRSNLLPQKRTRKIFLHLYCNQGYLKISNESELTTWYDTWHFALVHIVLFINQRPVWIMVMFYFYFLFHCSLFLFFFLFSRYAS